MKLVVVSATLDEEKTKAYWESWQDNARDPVDIVWVKGVMGVVPAFYQGVRDARWLGADIIACFHDDLRIDEYGWDQKVRHWFGVHQRCGLAGFFGAQRLGAGDIYASPYSPMQLARGDCGSNMVEAEKHGERWLTPRRAVCFDGFSQIGRAEVIVKGLKRLEEIGVVHHGYDSALGAMSIRDGWENWYLPIACHHKGGMTAVGSEKYNEWAKTQKENGDQGFWEDAHALIYEELRGVLPMWVSDED